ncbi:unnamed protein product [Periconia digitata]|uniref:Chromosome segregation in meiosis protein n=1 Tax=Periconia digitata TaxID=1303443 RepID=A0A9W4URU8_9PLEO|nr:unnamed protein product [Periconia digitata]
MAPIDPPNHNIPSDDDLDAILNGTLDGKDIFDTSNIEAQSSLPTANKKLTGDDVLGLEEEIKVTKTKQPIPKLDGELLLSDLGIPKLRKISKDRLKLKGKGHEYGDVARLLNMYQLWLDGLYPRAKFADGLFMIEKLGHTKNIQMMRKEWIDEGRPKNKSDHEDEVQDEIMAGQPARDSAETGPVTDDDGPREKQPERQEPANQTGGTIGLGDIGPDEDELDALLAEGESGGHRPNLTTTGNDPFADDMEAMAEMGDMW